MMKLGQTPKLNFSKGLPTRGGLTVSATGPRLAAVFVAKLGMKK
jgi:hypothetical protein